MSNFFDEPRQAAGFHVLIIYMYVFNPRNYVRDFTSIFMKIKEFNKPHKGLRRGVLRVRRGSKPAENAAHQDKAKKGHFRMDTNYFSRKVVGIVKTH